MRNPGLILTLFLTLFSLSDLEAQVVFTDDFGSGTVSNISTYSGPADAYSRSGTGTVDIRTGTPSPNGGAYVFSGFSPSLLNLSGSNSFTVTGINVGALSNIVISFYFRPVNNVLLSLGSRSFSVDINTGSGFTSLIGSGVMASQPDGTWSYVMSSVVAVTPGQNISLRFNASYTFLNIFGEANYSVDFIRVGSLATLPVSNHQFRATPVNGAVKLTWSAFATSNDGYFEVERSLNGHQHFTKLATIPVSGSGNADYTYTDLSAPRFAYYRIRTVDENRQISYSDALKVEQGQMGNGMTLYPSYASNTLHIKWTASGSEQVRIELLGMNGNLISSEVTTASAGNLFHALYVGHLRPGTYLCRLSSGNQSVTEKFVKQ